MIPQSAYRTLPLVTSWIWEIGRICKSHLDFVNIDYKLKVSSWNHYSVHNIKPLLALHCSNHWPSTEVKPNSAILHFFDLPLSARYHPYWCPCSYGCWDSPVDFFLLDLWTALVGVVCIFPSVFTPWEHGVRIFMYAEFAIYKPFIKLSLIRWLLFLFVRSSPNTLLWGLRVLLDLTSTTLSNSFLEAVLSFSPSAWE